MIHAFSPLHRRALGAGLLATTLLFANACGDDAEPATADTSADSTVADTTADTGADTTVDTGVDTSQPDTADTDAGEIVQATCGTDSPAALAACVELARIEADTRALAVTRAAGTAAHTQTRETLQTRLTEMGYTVELDSYGRGTNVIGVLTGTANPDDLVVISAHYDSTQNCAGADDNASGVAGALEAARVLAMGTHDRTIVIALWDEEERGKVGSIAWADKTARAGKRVVVSYVFEMIGYSSSEPDSQVFPPTFGLLFPEVQATLEADGSKGNFIALIVGDDAADYSDAMVSAGQQIGLPVIPVVMTADLRVAGALGDLRRSDHHSFWHHGWPAMMVTDTANFRNPNYHCTAGPDLPDDLDFDFARGVVAVTVSSASVALANSAPTAGILAKAAPCDLVSGGCAAGEHCTLTTDSTSWYVKECIAVQSTTVADGELCTRPNGKVGEDNCEAGSFCAFWGLAASNPPTRQCFPLCEAAADCAAGSQCQAIAPSYPRGGLCTTICDPFDAGTCPADTNCHGERSQVDGSPAWLCGRVGTVAAGGECTPTFDDCALGLGCAFDPTDGTGRCGVKCDDTNPCAVGACVPRVNNPAGSSRGVCR